MKRFVAVALLVMVGVLAPLRAVAQDPAGCDGFSAYQGSLDAIYRGHAVDLDAVRTLPQRDVSTISSDEWQHFAEISDALMVAFEGVTPPDWAYEWHTTEIATFGLIEQMSWSAAFSGADSLADFAGQVETTTAEAAASATIAAESCAAFHVLADRWNVGAGLAEAFGGAAETGTPIAGWSPVDADVASGCWTAADRGVAAGEEAIAGHQQWKRPPMMVIDPAKTYRATIVTSDGTIVVELYPKDAPVTVNNFVCLAEAGYYDGTPFHRIISGFVIQGGDPSGTGRGGPGYAFNDEPITKDYVKGTLAMANAGPNTNGSQFFICTGDLRGSLPKDYTIFGQVVEGMEIVDKLDNEPVTASSTGEKSSPVNPVTLIEVTITES
jgi:cyclophilin family peptidyl-prolyl cis-trans isomerase